MPAIERYCVCSYKDRKNHTVYQTVFDTVHFPNPDRDPEALRACQQRAQCLRALGREEVVPHLITSIPAAGDPIAALVSAGLVSVSHADPLE